MRFAGWTLCLYRCNSGLPLDTELRTMTHRPQEPEEVVARQAQREELVLVEAQVPVLAPAHVAHKSQSKPPLEAVCQGQGIDTKAH